MATITPEVLHGERKQDTRGRRIVDAERWRELLTAYPTSGLTQAQFARREGVNYHTFVARLARERGRSQPTGPGPTFVEARVAATGWPDAAALEVQLPGGVMVRGHDPATVAALVQALGRTG
jgi:transposase-like protein